jgi:hypothetical protein
VYIHTSVTNHTNKRVTLDVTERTLGPDGTFFRSQAWLQQNVPAGKTITLVDRFATTTTALVGSYNVGIRVTASSGGTTYFDNPNAASFTVTAPALYQHTRLSAPARTVVADRNGSWVATFTDGSHTVTLAGTQRTFSEPLNTTYTVTHGSWVRLLPTAFSGQVDEVWLTRTLADTAPDMLAISMQYIQDAPPSYNATGLQIGGDAEYGPLQEDGTRMEGADWNDYLGVDWIWNGKVYAPRQEFFRSVDCSGFVSIVFGYRGGLPVSRLADGTGIPRNASGTLEAAPGIIVIPNTGEQVTDFSTLEVGDLVFFDAATDDGTRIDHVGIYLGVDSGGYRRFISSRKRVNGPTLGDTGGRSALNGTTTYAKGFRATRRL